MGGRRPGQGEAGAAAPADAARHALPLCRRRDRARRRAGATRGRPRCRGRPLLARSTRAATPSAHRCRGTASPAAASPRRASARGCRWPTRRSATWPTRRATPGPSLELCRRAIAARQASEDLAVGPYRSLPSPAGTWAYARGEARHRPVEHVERDGLVRRRGRDGDREHRARPGGLERRGRAGAATVGGAVVTSAP